MIKDCQVGIKGLVCTDGKCLVLLSGTGDNAYWDVPGGRIDGNETIEETLRRELKEELPSVGKFLIGEIVGAYRLDTDLEGDRGLVLIFYKVEAETFDVIFSHEHTDFKWITKENISELRNPGVSIKPQLYSFLEKILS